MSQRWFLKLGERVAGPLTVTQLKKNASAGKIKPGTPLRLGDDGKWIRAEKVNGLFPASDAASHGTARDLETSETGQVGSPSDGDGPPTDQIERQVIEQNRTNKIVGLVLVPVALFLWYVSYWIVVYLIWLSIDLFDGPAHLYASPVAWIVIAAFAIEGVRRLRIEFKKPDIWSSDPDSIAAASAVLARRFSQEKTPLATEEIAARIVLCGAVATIESVVAFRSRLPADRETIDQAATVLGELGRSHDWTPAENFKNSSRGLLLLVQLRKVWVESRVGIVCVRIVPGTN